MIQCDDLLTHKKTSQAYITIRAHAYVALTIILTMVAELVPMQVYAVSSWNPTLIVNTESFQEIDVGDGTTSVDLRFGGSTSTLKLLSSGSFQFNKSLSVIGNISGSTLTVDRNANILRNLTVGSSNQHNTGATLVVERSSFTGAVNTGTRATLFSVGQMALGAMEGGGYFGRVGLKENQWGLANYGNTWTQKDSSRAWRGISMSSDGKIQSAVEAGGYIYVSTDYGNTWMQRASIGNWMTVAMSSDGKIQTALDADPGFIYISSDYGNTWRQKESSRSWVDVAMSSDGKIQAALDGSSGFIYMSNDFGNTWRQKGAARAWIGIAMSSDGKIQTATVEAGSLYVSTDYGNTWTARGSTQSWRGVSMSSDGKIQTVVAFGDDIYVSTNYGNTWTPKGLVGGGWIDTAMSSDGKIQAATDAFSYLYVSADYGNTWTPKESSRAWSGIAMSSDGKIQAATVFGDYLYISYANSSIFGTVSIGSGSTRNNTALHVVGTISGSALRVSGEADIHGAISASGAIRTDSDLTINDDRTTSADAVLTFGNSTTNQTLKYVHSLQKFQFSKSLSIVGSISGSSLTIDGVSSFSGALVAKSSVTAKGSFSGASLFGAGLGDCNNSTTSKLIYNPSTGKFSCATDQTGGGSSGGLGYSDAQGIFVKKSGDTMTGALTIRTLLTHTTTGALNVVQQTHATGAYIKSTTHKEPALAIDIIGTSNAPHLLFGYQGIFDANLYRSEANLLKTDDSFFALGTISGSKLRVSGAADIHGPLTVSGSLRGDGDFTINDDRTTSADATLTFGNSTINQTLKYVHSLQKFQFSKDLSVLGAISGSTLRVDGSTDIHGALSASGAVHFDSNLSINDDRTAGVDTILTFGNGTLNQDLKYIDATQRFQFSKDLNVMGSISGASLVISGASSFSGSALFKRALTTKGALSGATFFGGGLGDCNNATTSKLIYNPSTGRFSCATDQTGGGSSGGGLGYGDIEGMFVNQGGDTMTGTLNIKVTSADVVKTTTGNTNATDFSKAGSTFLNATSENDVITMDRGTVPSGGLGTFGASSVVTTAALGAGAHTILRDDGKFVTFLGNASTTVNLWDGISTSMSTMTVATTAIGAGAISLRRADGRYLVVPGGASSAGFVYDPFNITANSAVTLTSCTGTTGTNAFLVSTGSYIIMCGGSGNWGVYNSTSNQYQAGVALGANFGAGAHAIQRDDGTFLVFAGGNTSSHWIFHPGMSMAKAWSAINPIPTNAPTITTGAFSVRRSDGTFLVVGGAANASTIYNPTSSSTDRFGTFTSQSGVGFGPTFALADGAQALWRQDRKYVLFQGGSANTNIIDLSRADQFQFVAGSGIGASAGAGFHAFYNGRGTVQLLLGGATTTTRYYDVGYIKGGPSTSTGSYYETECITTALHSGSYLTWKMNGDDLKTKVFVRTGNGACSGSYKSIMKIGDLIRPVSGHNSIQMKVVFERQPAKFADQEWGLRRGLSQTQYRRLMDIPGLHELVVRNTANLHRTQFEFGRGGSVGEPLAVNLINNGDKNLQLQLANLVTYPTTINATNTNFYNGAFMTHPVMPRTTSIGTVVLKRPDGKFVIIPGSSTGSTAQQRSMIYDQDTNAFYNNSASPTVTLSSGALAFKRHDGTFLIVAGGNTTNTNIYDPVANTFTAGPVLTHRVAEGSQVLAMPNGRVTIIHGGFKQTTTLYDSLSNSTVSGAMLITTVGRGSFVIPKPDGKYIIGPGVSTQGCALRTTTMIFDPYANYFTNNASVVTVTGTGPGAYAVERSDGQWLVVKGGGLTAGTCAGATATQIYNPFANKMIAGPALTVASRYGSVAMQRPDGTWLIAAGGGLATTNLVNEKSGAFTAEGFSNIGTSQAGPSLPTAIGTGAIAFQRDDGKYVILTGANAIGSPGTNTVQLYDAGWVIDGYYRSEAINIPDLDSSSTLSWQSPDYRGIAARVRTGTSALTLQTADERELSTSGDRINPGVGETWAQVNFSFRRYVPANKGLYEDVWYNGGAMPQFHLRPFANPSITQFSIGKDKDLANFKVDETSLFRVSGNGDIYTGLKGSLFSGGADLAERYHSSDQLVAGDLVTFDYTDDHGVRRSTGSYQPELIGIVSTNPGFVAGAYTKNSYPIALVGRVPVNVSLENGPIKTGDRITSASIPGYAMKATRAGRVVGIALESSKPETFVPCAADTKKMCGQVMVFVNLSDWNGPTQ